MAFLRELLASNGVKENNLSDVKNIMIDFLDRMHDRILEKSQIEEEEIPGSWIDENAHRLLIKVNKNINELCDEYDNADSGTKSAEDIANLAMIVDYQIHNL